LNKIHSLLKILDYSILVRRLVYDTNNRTQGRVMAVRAPPASSRRPTSFPASTAGHRHAPRLPPSPSTAVYTRAHTLRELPVSFSLHIFHVDG